MGVLFVCLHNDLPLKRVKLCLQGKTAILWYPDVITHLLNTYSMGLVEFWSAPTIEEALPATGAFSNSCHSIQDSLIRDVI